jgi:hypothetical protein
LKGAVLHNGACGYSSMAKVLKIPLTSLLKTVSSELLEKSKNKEKEEIGKGILACMSSLTFIHDEIIPTQFWCSGTTLDIISKIYDTSIMVFSRCFEAPGYMLSGVYSSTIINPEKIVYLMYCRERYNPLFLSSSIKDLTRSVFICDSIQ